MQGGVPEEEARPEPNTIPGGPPAGATSRTVVGMNATGARVPDLIAKCSVPSDGVLDNTGGTATTGDFLVVVWRMPF